MIYFFIEDLPKDYQSKLLWSNYQNYLKDPFVKQIVSMKNEYLSLLNSELERLIGVKNKKFENIKKGVEKTISFAFKAFLSMTFAGQLTATAAKLIKEQGIVPEKKKKDFDLFEVLDHIDIFYYQKFDSGFIYFGIKDTKWDSIAKQIEFGGSKNRAYHLFSKVNKQLEQIYFKS